MKYCPACKLDKPEEAFYAESKRPGGLSSNCKDCKNQRNRENWREKYYPANKEVQKASVAQRRRDRKAEAREAAKSTEIQK